MITEYQKYDTFKTVTFTYDDSYKAIFTVHKNGKIYVEVQDGFPLDDFENAIEIVKSGRLEIDL